jgi:hypothetical protein
MRAALSQILMLSLLAMTSGCGGQGTTAFVSGSTGTNVRWNAFVSSPSLPIFVAPGQSLTIIVQLIPSNGFLLTGPVFFNNFIGANPALFGCPGLLSVGNPFLGGVGFGFVPRILVPISPIGVGTCSFPLNLGLSGIVTIIVQVATVIVLKHTQYVVRVAPVKRLQTVRSSSGSPPSARESILP